MDGKNIRLSRLFPAGGKSVVVAMDHGQTFGPLEGLVDFPAAAEKLVEADGVLMAPQMVRFSGRLYQGARKPVVINRLNWNTIHCEPWHYREAYTARPVTAAECIQAGAEIVLASLVLQTGSEQHDAANVEVFTRCVSEAHALGIPIIGEIFSIGGLRDDPAKFHEYIKTMARIICELGADAIKTFYTGERFPEVAEGTPIPIFALGAEKLENEVDALKLAQKAVRDGAAGVVFGRNVIQAKDPARFLKGLKAVVAGELKPLAAAREFGLE